jgi:dTDP-4-dehydrorhamnose 3,5-epimerase
VCQSVCILEKSKKNMAWTPSILSGVWVYTPKVFADDRGYFFESYNHSTLPDELVDILFVQDNEAMSQRGVTRGLHYQVGSSAQSKLVRCVLGDIIDVIVDVRPDSETYGEHERFELTGKNKVQVFIPAGFAHGYSVLSETAIFAYKCDNFYDKDAEGSITPLDKTLNIDWGIDTKSMVFSDKDKDAPSFGKHRAFEW